MKNLLMLAVTASLSQLSIAQVEQPDEPMSIWFTKPGKTFHEAGPIGNGRLGAMDLGGVESQRVVLNESSMWSGGPYKTALQKNLWANFGSGRSPRV